MPLVGPLVEHPAHERSGAQARGRRVPLGEGHFTGAVDNHEEVRPLFFGVPFGQIEQQLANGLVLALLFSRRRPVFVPWQAAATVVLQTAGQRLRHRRPAHHQYVREKVAVGARHVQPHPAGKQREFLRPQPRRQHPHDVADDARLYQADWG